MRLNRYLVSWIVVQLEMPDFMGGYHGCVFRILVQGNIDEPRSSLQKTQDAFIDDTPRFVILDFEVVNQKSSSYQAARSPVTVGTRESLSVELSRLSTNINPSVHC
jgi:hypothetical protein